MNNILTTKAVKSIRWMIFLLVAFCSINDTYASHMAGGDLEYICIGPRRWTIKLTIYRFCEGIDLCPNGWACTRQLTVTPSPTASFGGLNPDGCTSNPNQLSVTVTLQSVDDVGKGNVTRCGMLGKNGCTNMGQVAPGGYRPSIEKYVFTGTLDMSLPSLGTAATCPYWDVAFVESARNDGTVNVQNPGGTNFCIQATINIQDRSNVPCINNSPVMKNEPVAIFCGGQEYIFNMGAVDPDRDSLTYQIVKSLASPNVTINYNLPFSEKWPFPLVSTSPPHSAYTGQPFVVLDSANGDLALNANNGGPNPIGGDMSVRIFQWSYREQPAGSGRFVPFIVGITMRNLQIYSIPCPGNNPPRFTTLPPAPNGGPKYNWTVCAGDQICFLVTAKDTDFKPLLTPPRIDTTYLSWNQGIVRAAGKVAFKPYYDASMPRPREDVYQFCWLTEESDGSTLPYYITIQGEDNFCPNPGRVIRAFSIKVQPKPKISISIDKSLQCGKVITRMFKVDVRQNLTFAEIKIAKAPFDYGFLNGEYMKTTTSANPTGSGTAPRMIFADTVEFKVGGKYLVKIRAQSPGAEAGTFCETIVYDTITVDTMVQAFARDTFVCKYSSISIEAKVQWGTGPYSYRWYRNNTSGTPVNPPSYLVNKTHLANDTVQTKYIIRVADAFGCFSLDSMILSIKQLPRPTLLDSLRICSYDSLKIDGGNNSGNMRKYTWYKNGNLLTDTAQTITRNDSGHFVLLMTDTFGCRMFDTIKLYVNLPVKAYAGLDTTACPGDTLTLKGTGGYKYEWRQARSVGPPLTISPKGYIDSVRISPPANTTTNYLLTAYWAYPDSSRAYKECFNVDTVQVKAKPQPNIGKPGLVTACSNNDTIFMPFINISPANQLGGVGKWSYRRAPGAIQDVSPNTILFVDSLGNLPADTLIPYMEDNGELIMKRYWVKYSYRGPASEGACLKEDSLEIKIYPLPDINAGADKNFCTTGSPYPLNGNNTTQGAILEDPTGKIGVWTIIQGGGLTSNTVSTNTIYTFNPNPAAPGGTGMNLSPVANRLRYTYSLTYKIPSQLMCANFDEVDFMVTTPPELKIPAPKTLKVCKSDAEFNIREKSGSTTTASDATSKWSLDPTTSIPDIKQAISNDSLRFNPRHGQVPDNGGTWKLIYRDIASGCEVKDVLTITVIASPKVTLSPERDSLCQSDPPLNMTFTSSIPDPGVFGGPGISQTGVFDVQNAAIIPGNNYRLSYTVTTAEGCFGTDTSDIYVQKQPTVSVSLVDPKCNYDSISPFLLAATVNSPEFGVKWTSDGTGLFDNDKSLTPKYTFNTSDANQRIVKATVTTTGNGACPPDMKQVTMDIYPKPNADILGDSLEGCAPLTFYLGAAGSGIGGSAYQWFVDDMNTVLESDSDFSRTITGWGNYKVRLVVTAPAPANCTNLSDTIIRVRAIPVADFENDPSHTTIARPYFNFNNKSTVGDGNPMSYIWNFGPDPTKPTDTITPRLVTESDPRNVQFPSSDGKIMIKLRAISKYNGYECVHDTFKYVQIDPDITVFIPSAFRPVDGGNGVPCADPTFSDCNDVFRVYAAGFATIEVFVFNRWGQQVFSTNNPDIGWNGKVKNSGEVCPQDVYIYQINATSFNSKKYTYSGSVTLLR